LAVEQVVDWIVRPGKLDVELTDAVLAAEFLATLPEQNAADREVLRYRIQQGQDFRSVPDEAALTFR
jgi:hypothetical protein